MTAWLFGLNLVLLALLLVFVVMAALLLRRLARLRRSEAEMRQLLADFGVAIARAEAGLKDMRHVVGQQGPELLRLLGRAETAQEELQTLLALVNREADQMVARHTPSEPDKPVRSKAEQALQQALRGEKP